MDNPAGLAILIILLIVVIDAIGLAIAIFMIPKALDGLAQLKLLRARIERLLTDIDKEQRQSPNGNNHNE